MKQLFKFNGIQGGIDKRDFAIFTEVLFPKRRYKWRLIDFGTTLSEKTLRRRGFSVPSKKLLRYIPVGAILEFETKDS